MGKFKAKTDGSSADNASKVKKQGKPRRSFKKECGKNEKFSKNRKSKVEDVKHKQPEIKGKKVFVQKKIKEINPDEVEDLMDALLENEEFGTGSIEEAEIEEDAQGESESEAEEEDGDDNVEMEVEQEEKKPSNVKLSGVERMAQWIQDSEERLVMDNWGELNVSETILCALESEGLTNPTEIQRNVVRLASHGFDIFGAAETGSGKTLAFLVPVLENLLKHQEEQGAVDFKEKKLSSLCMAPTRELAMQINKEFKKFSKFTNFRSAAIIGGMSEERQKRLLDRKPDVIIATPGRFWSWVSKHPYAGDFTELKNVVIDEIDRMLEKGHFREMNEIIEKIHEQKMNKLQTLVFSATLTFLVLPDVEKAQQTRESKLREIAKTTKMRKNYKVIDLTNEFATPTTLKERRICCQSLLEKDSRLYYLLLTYRARTLIFTNSIDASQRIYSILLKLKVSPTPLLLHAKMQERKRLKNLDRFASNPSSVLIATDVAARGLDIKNIENVIHYQIPRTAEDYIHRSGRTARALKNGLSILLLDPQDVQRYKKICKSLHRENELQNLEVDNLKRVDAIKNRCYLASEIEKLEYQLRKVSSAVNWKKRMAKEADLELSDEGEEDTESDEANKRRLKKSAEKALKSALAQPLPMSSLA